ncbi:PLP-dependent aminotransferase family protein [Streptomyces sp. TLI_146]|uniref:MocR-like pyridoxine biosynthesis transcription factor PdxR n=1 Tax=Streptomyces sp. TLI_146 TaxID=1938858 RepID=UPI000C70F1CE|nr:PLP-dependent aminotransferase family protein [Streptomyces sp. TLI_146]PKV87018.1 GntR family transcriptional regulator/MocR family aminotransferase [Streptomyces sp. TLI_146]
MADSWVNSAERIGADLHVELAGSGSRRAALIRALRAAVQDGRLAPGTRLPPYRSLAADLGLARNTVADAYAELVAEGWLTARQGSGTRVATRAEPVRAARVPKKVPRRATAPAHNLMQGQPDAGSFPRGAWLSAARRALNAAPNEAFGPGDPQGRVELRRALAGYLARVRGVRTAPERIVVCSGFAHALRLLFGGQVLRGPLAVESYGLAFHRSLLAAEGVRTVPVGLDERGATVAELTEEAALKGVRAALLTPAHQFPTGGPLHPERRAAVVDWARARGRVILEDDYDGEFRYDREPVGAVQGLDPERVVYIGSVSKSLSPAVRLGWMVLPEQLVDPVLAAKGRREAWASVLDQLTLADLIESGAYDRHVRRMRQRYRGRRDQLLAALDEHAPHITAAGIAAGLHAVLRLPPGTERAVLKAAAWQGIALDGLAAYRHPDATMPGQDGLVVGYATPPDHAYQAALDALCRALPPAP